MKHLGIKLDRSLGFKYHIDHVTTEAIKELAAIKMLTTNREQWLLVVLYQGLVLSVI